MMVLGFFLLSGNVVKAQTDNSSDFQKGLTAYDLGDFQQALLYFNKAIANNPNSWQAYLVEGYCYFHLGQDIQMKLALFESLRLHPDNPELKTFMSNLPGKGSSSTNAQVQSPPAVPTLASPTPETAKAKKIKLGDEDIEAAPSKTPTTGADLTNANLREKWGSSSWLKITGGLGYGALGDLANAANVWNQEIAQARAQGTASFSNVGYRFVLEGGIPLDKTNSWSVQADFETGHNFEASLVYSSPVTQNISPQLLAFGMNYYHYFPYESGRFFLMGGVFFGEALVNFYSDDPIETDSGVLTGNSFGFNLGFGNELKISPSTGFEISGRFRYLTISQVRNNYLVTSYSNTGQVVLAADANGNLGLADTRSIGQGGLRYATVDFTGFNLNCGFVFHLF